METRTYEEELVGRITVVRGVEDLVATSRNGGMGISKTAYAVVAHQGLETEAEFRVSLDPTGERAVVSALLGKGVTASGAYLIA